MEDRRVASLFLKALNSQRLGQISTAENKYKEVLQYSPFHPDANHNLGIIYKSKGDFDQALTFLKKAVFFNPNVKQFWVSLLGTAMHLGMNAFVYEILTISHIIGLEIDEVRANLPVELNTAAKLIDKSEPSEFLRDFILMNRNKGNFDKAMKLTGDFLKLYPKSVILHNLKGILHADSNNFPEAARSYEMALRQQPGSTVILNNLAISLRAQDKIHEAIKCLERAIQINQNYLEARYNLANILCEAGNMASAIHHYEKALLINPYAAEVHYNLAVALEASNDKSQAIEHYKKCIEQDKNFSEAYINLGNLCFSEGTTIEAVEYYLSALQIKPRDLSAWRNLKFATLASQYQFPDFKFDPNFESRLYDDNVFLRLLEINKLQMNTNSTLISEMYLHVRDVFETTKSEDIIAPRYEDFQIKALNIHTRKVFALIHFGRSGTGLLHSLIDSHPNVATLPSIYLARFFDEFTWDEISDPDITKLLRNFISKFEFLFDSSSDVPFVERSLNLVQNIGASEGLTCLGDNKDEVLYTDAERFYEYALTEIQKIGFVNPRIFFEVIHDAFDRANEIEYSKQAILYHIHNPDLYTTLNFVSEVKNTKFIIMVREPLQSCESWCGDDFEELNYTEIVNKIVTMLTTFDLPVLQDHECLIIRLEDLKLYPERTLRSLAEKMDIEFDKCLFEMTVVGKKWWGDPSSPNYASDGMKPFGLSPITQKVGTFFSSNDQEKLKILFYEMRKICGYADLSESKVVASKLKDIEASIDTLFDFEVDLMLRMGLTEEQFKSQGAFSYFRSMLQYRCNAFTNDILQKYKLLNLI